MAFGSCMKRPLLNMCPCGDAQHGYTTIISIHPHKAEEATYLSTHVDPMLALRASSHEVPSHLSSIRAISTIESMEAGTYHFTRVLKSSIPSMTWVPTWQQFLEVRLGRCVESRSVKTPHPTSRKCCAQHNQDPQHCSYWMRGRFFKLLTVPHNTVMDMNNVMSDFKKSFAYFNGFLRLKSWDFASMLEFVYMSGGLRDPMWSGLINVQDWSPRFILKGSQNPTISPKLWLIIEVRTKTSFLWRFEFLLSKTKHKQSGLLQVSK